MCRRAEKFWRRALLAMLLCVASAGTAAAQRAGADDAEFGPVVRTYLGYLRAEQEVVDDRASRREINQNYYRRNSNRIRALRQMALRIARETKNDFLPELYAVTRDELGTLFDPQPEPATFRAGEVVNNTFRYLGTVRSVEPFYLFARLDVYEQAELLQKQQEAQPQDAQPAATSSSAPEATPTTATTTINAPRGKSTATTRPRRVSNTP
ncbi:MAG TPA: hypothetical protein VGO96_21260 [Pyrinomonadaceae bacterium]|jgi:hypothetical protein|nr:hypothetical protein [Pyrinomonadaceae bacterium]